MTKEEIITLMNKLANQTVEAMELIDRIDALFERLSKVSPELFRTINESATILAAFEKGLNDGGGRRSSAFQLTTAICTLPRSLAQA